METHYLTFPITLQHFNEARQRTERRRLMLQTGRRRRDRHLAVVIPLPRLTVETHEFPQAS